MIELTIPRIADSRNVADKQHWSKRFRASKEWTEEVWLALKQQQVYATTFERAKVSIHRQSLGQLDPDNLVASAKPVIDALRKNGVIANDTSEHIELTVTQGKGKPLTRIRVESL